MTHLKKHHIWRGKHEKREREEMPPGLILCADASYEHVDLLRLEEGGMYVAEYLTDLPPRRLLEAKLHEAIRMAREQIAVREGAGCGVAKSGEGLSVDAAASYGDATVQM
ncbi:MAG: hypothetical protein U9R21_01565 [Candidatus Thermoplasmatota archaeon]|nr:hypothetical protein [Candidatus Thermoplasmatota archaeon]